MLARARQGERYELGRRRLSPLEGAVPTLSAGDLRIRPRARRPVSAASERFNPAPA